MKSFSCVANNKTGLTKEEIKNALYKSIEGKNLKRVLIVPPDYTRYHSNAGYITNVYYHALKDIAHVDIMPALGTHVPMTCEECADMYGDIPFEKFLVHNWRDDVINVGPVPERYMKEISEDTWNSIVECEVNKILFKDYDLIISVGQLYEHHPAAGMKLRRLSNTKKIISASTIKTKMDNFAVKADVIDYEVFFTRVLKALVENGTIKKEVIGSYPNGEELNKLLEKIEVLPEAAAVADAFKKAKKPIIAADENTVPKAALKVLADITVLAGNDKRPHRGLIVLKAKANSQGAWNIGFRTPGEEIKKAERKYNKDVKLNNIDLIEKATNKKIDLVDNETVLKMSKKRKELYEKDGEE